MKSSANCSTQQSLQNLRRKVSLALLLVIPVLAVTSIVPSSSVCAENYTICLTNAANALSNCSQSAADIKTKSILHCKRQFETAINDGMDASEAQQREVCTS